MDDDAASALEQAVAELGTLLVQMGKFREARSADAEALRQAAFAVGDRARRAHRHGALTPPFAAELAADAAALRSALHGWLDARRTSAPYRAAVAAAGDDSGLPDALAAVFDVTVAPPPATVFHPVVWQRRGRPRTATDIADDVAHLLADGIAGDRDPEAPGVDPALPGVVFPVAVPPGQPVYLSIDAGALPGRVLVLPDGDVVVPGARVRVAATVTLADPADPDLDEWAMDPVAFRDALEAALAARGLPVARA